MNRVFNFSAGPSMLPFPVLEQIQKDLLSYKNTGCSVMEMSHRSKMYEPIISHAEETLRQLMNISNEYAVLFAHGGASLQFSTIAMNLASRTDNIDYVITGEFASKAFIEAKRWSSNTKAIVSSKDKNFTYIPHITKNIIRRNSKYLHITVNNTIYGTQYNQLPDTGNIPLVGDISSIILGKEYDINKFGLMYAGTQKNMGPAGVCVIIVKKRMLRELDAVVPPLLSFEHMMKNQSMPNTPATFTIYVMGLVFDWLQEMGGVREIQKVNEEKATLLYDFIDNSQFFTSFAKKEDRSIMNVNFVLKNDQLTNEFLKLTESRGLVNLKGHRAVGGCRASIYNAMPIEGVNALIACMKEFEKEK
ncbi:MAG: 3-phosphoserine/phosphohydroxythreonine transaminase [Chitinophagaceae bacterium]